ncbi:uncharacterized protein LOC118187338 [Stegodyphus dumicola]|uniref:uncharacterized protein LOC118187338 n=1 Tax=Stegodyphus dumicola TaxID=202533 RepID=UPI0015AAFF49|nr:uncharacterized protein LOC118187338 [Stegodyphus dumicola]
MSTRELFHLFLLCLSCFEVLFCEYIGKDSFSNLASIEEEAFTSENPNFLDESFTRKLRVAKTGSRYLEAFTSENPNFLDESFTRKLRVAKTGSRYLEAFTSENPNFLDESFTRKLRVAKTGSRYLEAFTSENPNFLDESFTRKLRVAKTGSRYLEAFTSENPNFLNESFTRKLRVAKTGSRYLEAFTSENPNFLNESFTRTLKAALQEIRYLNRKRKPNRGDTEFLFGLMGDDFHPEWMSARKPKKPWKNLPLSELSVNVSEEILAKQKHLTLFENVNFTKELAHLQPDLLPYENEIKSWLTKRASCSVFFRWKSLGRSYWPSWFRYGYCLHQYEKCSLPFGMRCLPAEAIELYFLRWKCSKRIRSRRDVGKLVIYTNIKNKHKKDYASTERTRCYWEKVRIPITVTCQCSC